MARTRIDIELRWGDQDAYAHINNVAYARYLEEARVRTFELGSGRERTGMEQHFGVNAHSQIKMLVASQSIEYLRVLEYSEHPIAIEMWIGRVGGASLELHYEILDGAAPERTVVVRAITNMVVVDGQTLRPVRLSEGARASIEPWMDEPLALRRV